MVGPVIRSIESAWRFSYHCNSSVNGARESRPRICGDIGCSAGVERDRSKGGRDKFTGRFITEREDLNP
jgi:hypothetical protein